MRSVLRVLGATLVLAGPCACDRASGTGPEPLPDPFMTVRLTGAITDSLQGTPWVTRAPFIVDDYRFELFAELSRGGYQYIQIWGEGSRPDVATYALTPWREGQAGSRMHALFGREVAGGPAMYHAVSGTLRITHSGPEGIAGEFAFHGVPGHLLPERAVLSPEIPPIEVRGRFSARCAEPEACR